MRLHPDEPENNVSLAWSIASRHIHTPISMACEQVAGAFS
jgi:hypothetical protein